MEGWKKRDKQKLFLKEVPNFITAFHLSNYMYINVKRIGGTSDSVTAIVPIFHYNNQWLIFK